LAAAAKAKADPFKCDAGYSPDTIYAENMFFIAEDRCNKLQAKKKARTVKEHEARLEKVMKEIQDDGILEKNMKTMPQRCKGITSAGGGPTKW
tara:strand:+ start:445 stop:723 length:279 start_codon:yes stop_codon:yes gene_type:complete